MAVRTISEKMEGTTLKVVREVTELLTEQDIQQRRSQLSYQLTQLKQQMQQLKAGYAQTETDILACDAQLAQFANVVDTEL